MEKITGGKAIINTLKNQNVETVFGVISVHTLHLFDALFSDQQSIRYIGGRTEMGCGFMADGYSRASAGPGVFLSSSGPGAANSMHAMGEAYHSYSPILQLTTNVEKQYIDSGRGVLHEAKQQIQMFRSVTSWNKLVTHINEIPSSIQEAFRLFHSKLPRPIELEFSTDVLSEIANLEIPQTPEFHPPAVDEQSVTEAIYEIIRAKRPVIWVGEQLNYTGGTSKVIKLAEILGAPVVTANGAKDLFPEDHSLSLGTSLGNRIWGNNPVHEFIANCDLVIAIGTALPYRGTLEVGLKLPGRIIHISLDGEGINKNFKATVGIAGNARFVLERICSLLGNKDCYKGDKFKRESLVVKKNIYSALKNQWPNELRVLEGIRSVLPRDVITCWDTTVPASRATRGFPVFNPGTFINPFGWVGIGFGFPASLGAKAAKPGKRVVCFTGDGGFQYCMAELATALQYDLNITVVMFNDNSWGVLKGLQKTNFQGRYMGTELANPDFVELVGSYGFEGVRVQTLNELLIALDSSIKRPKLSLIEVLIPSGLTDLR